MNVRKETDKERSGKLPPGCGGDGKRHRNGSCYTKIGKNKEK